MLRKHRKAVALVVVFVCALVFAAAAVQASGEGKWVFRQGAGPINKAAPHHQFTRPGVNRDICAEGWCVCGYCECYGTFDCCLVGCVVCWEFTCGQT